MLLALGNPVGQQCTLAATIIANQHQRELHVAIQRISMRVERCEEGISSRDINVLCHARCSKRLVLVEQHISCRHDSKGQEGDSFLNLTQNFFRAVSPRDFVASRDPSISSNPHALLRCVYTAKCAPFSVLDPSKPFRRRPLLDPRTVKGGRRGGVGRSVTHKSARIFLPHRSIRKRGRHRILEKC